MHTYQMAFMDQRSNSTMSLEADDEVCGEIGWALMLNLHALVRPQHSWKARLSSGTCSIQTAFFHVLPFSFRTLLSMRFARLIIDGTRRWRGQR